MADQDEHVWQPSEPVGYGDRSAGLLTPKASSLAGFTLAVLSMLGQGSWTTALEGLLGPIFRPSFYGTALVLHGVASLALACCAVLIARRAMAARREDAWDHVARAAVLIGGLGAALAALTIVGALVGPVS